MSANIASLQATAGAASQLLANGTNVAESSAPPAEAGPFAALFQQLLGKQAGIDLSSSLLTLETGVAIEPEAAENAEELTALLPFLEAMGLVQPPATMPVNVATSDQDMAPLTNGQFNTDKVTTNQKMADSNNGQHNVELTTTPTAQAVQIPANSAVTQQSLVNEEAAQPVPTDIHQSTEDSPLVEQQNATLLSGNGKGEVGSTTIDFNSQLNTAMAEAKENVQANGQHSGIQTSGQIQTEKNAPSPHFSITPQVGTKSWGEDVGNHVVWMVNRQESRAELVLTPPQMGRVEVSLAVTGDQATASFVSGNPAVREALESALPRLREILADAGIQLGQAQVGAESSHQSAQREKNGDNFTPKGNTGYGTLPQQTTSTQTTATGLKVGQGLVDVFA